MPDPTMAIFTERAADLAGNFVFHPGRDRPEVAHQPEKGHQTEGVVGQVNFALEEALAGSTGKKMMVVVPTFSKGEESEPKIIFAFVLGFITAGSE